MYSLQENIFLENPLKMIRISLSQLENDQDHGIFNLSLEMIWVSLSQSKNDKGLLCLRLKMTKVFLCLTLEMARVSLYLRLKNDKVLFVSV